MSEKFKVVISGVSGRFPESDDISTFKEKLYNGDNFVTVDDRKWSVGYKHKLFEEKFVPDATGKLPNFHMFDYPVFKMNNAWATGMDVLNRINLEPTFEAIVDAGVNPYSLDGRNVAVIMSTGMNEMETNMLMKSNLSKKVKMYSFIGQEKTMLSNRVSYVFNLTGPSFTNFVDNHGGLESLSMAYRYVADGIAEAAIVCVPSSIMDPRISLQYCTLGLLSDDGACRPFDEQASGYVRSEGVISIFLQRAEDARRNYGEIRFCDVLYAGSMQRANILSQTEENLKMSLRYLCESNDFLRELSTVAFVEMNANGHKFQDKIESNAVADLLTVNRVDPLMVGSIKSNIGQAEATSGLMAILKAIFALDTGVLAPNKNLQKVNPEIRAFKENRLQVVTEKTELKGDTVAINSFGLFGSIGLAVIKQHKESRTAEPQVETIPRVLLMCGREEKDLLTKLKKIEASSYHPDFVTLVNDAFQQDMPFHSYRGFTILPTPAEPIHCVEKKPDLNRPVWFIFSGMGSQWNGMGKDLLRLPIFAETVAKCNEALKPKNVDVYNILTSEDPTLFDDITNAFVGIATIQIGLLEVVKALGIVPDGIIGHSAGENCCAYLDGCLTLEQAVLAMWARGVASREVETVKGMMAAVGKGYNELKDQLPENVEIACHNSASSCTLSGPAECVEAYVQKLQKEGVFARAVNVANTAFHSTHILPVAPKLRSRLLEVVKEERKRRSSKWISTCFPENEWNTPAAQFHSGEYHVNNLVHPVFFEEGCRHIPANAICIEFAPHGFLQPILKRALPKTCTNVSLTNRAKPNDNLNFLLSAIGRLYMAGLEPQVNNIFPALKYPVARGTPSLAPYCSWYHVNIPIPFHLRSRYTHQAISSEVLPISVRDDSRCSYLKNHKFNDEITIPSAFIMYLVWQIHSHTRSEEVGSSSVVFRNIRVHNNIVMKVQDTKYASVYLQYGSGNFQVNLLDNAEGGDDFQIVQTGCISPMYRDDIESNFKTLSSQNCNLVTKSQFYNTYQQAGYNLGPGFDLVNELHQSDTEYDTSITWNGNWVMFIDGLMKTQMFADNNGYVKGKVPTFVRELAISAQKISSLENGTAIPCRIDAVIGELCGLGVAMRSLKYKTIAKPNRGLSGFRFVAHKNPRCQNIHEFFNLCLQLAVESIAMLGSSSYKLTVWDTTSKYLQNIKDAINNVHQVSPESVLVLHSPGKFVGVDENFLVITNKVDDLEKLGASPNEMLILFVSLSAYDGEICSKYGCIELTKQVFSANTFTLFLKKRTIKNGFNHKNTMLIEDTIIAADNPPDTIVCKNIDSADIPRLISKKRNHLHTKYVYIMDDIQSEQKLKKLLHTENNTSVHTPVFKLGEWGSYRNLSPNNGNCKNQISKYTLLSKISQGPMNMDSVCLYGDNFDNDATPTMEKILQFAYVTTINGGGRKMGFATVSASHGVECDQYLCWTALKGWSPEQAVTVPYVYAQAYNLLHLLPNCEEARTVMITVGTEYALAEAVIAMALFKNQIVYVIVNSEEEAMFYMENFPQLNPHHIFCKEKYEIPIRCQTNGEGIDLVINCLTGIGHVNASLACVGRFGFYIEFGKGNCRELFDIDLFHFLRSVSFGAVRNSVSTLLKLSVEAKLRMKTFLDTCINNGIVVPPLRRGRSRFPLTNTKILDSNFLKEIRNCNSTSMKYDARYSYIIIAGTGTKDVSLVELITWLICRGASKFLICHEKSASSSNDLHQIKRLCAAHEDVEISLHSTADGLNDKGEARVLVNGAEKLGPLEAIFFVSNKTPAKTISNLDEIVSPDVQFVGLSSGGLKEFEQRRSRGSPAVLVHGDDFEDVLSALPHLDEILSRRDNNNIDVLYRVVDILPKRNYNAMKVVHEYPNLRDYLPHNIHILNEIGRVEASDLKFVEETTLTSRYRCPKEVQPIFALPAIHSVLLRPLFRRLQYPVFSATSVSTSSINEAASTLYQSLNKIYPSGPVSVISETWTLPLALELVSYAEQDNRKYKIFVLEGNPKNWSDEVERMMLASQSRRSETIFADEIFHFNKIKKEKYEYHSDAFTSFENKVKMYALNELCDTDSMRSVMRAAKMIKNQIIKLEQQTPLADRLLKNVTWFERYLPSDPQFFNLSITSEFVVLEEPNYRRLLKNPQVSKIINENTLFTWWT